MTGPGRQFSADELDADEGGDLLGLLSTGREIESEAARSAVQPSADFADRVQAAIAAEPSPDPLTVAARAARAGRWSALVAAVRDGWRVAFGANRPLAARAPALALVLVAAVAVTSVGGAATVGALQLLTPDESPPPSELLPTPSPSPSPSPTPTPTPTTPPTPSPSPSASDEPTPTGTDDNGGNSGPGSTDDNGGNSGPGSTDDNGGNSGPGSDNSGPGSY